MPKPVRNVNENVGSAHGYDDDDDHLLVATAWTKVQLTFAGAKSYVCVIARTVFQRHDRPMREGNSHCAWIPPGPGAVTALLLRARARFALFEAGAVAPAERV
jgi:hypothetical protein